MTINHEDLDPWALRLWLAGSGLNLLVCTIGMIWLGAEDRPIPPFLAAIAGALAGMLGALAPAWFPSTRGIRRNGQQQ